jgi:hypothetical protein
MDVRLALDTFPPVPQIARSAVGRLKHIRALEFKLTEYTSAYASLQKVQLDAAAAVAPPRFTS